MSGRASDFGSGLLRGARNSAESTWSDLKSLGQGTWDVVRDAPGAREQFWATTRAGAQAVASYGSQAYEDPAIVWRDARDTVGRAWTAGRDFAQTADAGQWGEAVGGGGFVAASSALGGGLVTKGVQAVNRGAQVAARARQVARADAALPDLPARPVVPCPKAVAKTKTGMKLRTDLGDEHFDADGRLIWPLNDGFAGTPVTTSMQPGMVIDRYSNATGLADRGSFFAPAGTDYAARALPYDRAQMQYAQYRVLKPFDSLSGPAASAFDQAGGGLQFKTSLSTQQLVQQGYLAQIYP